MTDKQHMNIVVAGHVDHGKSTVIGRLLADTHSLPDGKIEQIREMCRRNSKPFEYAFLLDALKDERSQGITIDTARCFFETEKRKYIIIDAPGHIEFLKNMITGASRAQAALLVIDAAEGICENSRRHGYMLEMLGITQIAVLVNKIDLIGYDRARYDWICRDFTEFLAKIGIKPAAYIPVSAMDGDNIAAHSTHTPWYDGPTVLEMLDRFVGGTHNDALPLRIPVQGVYKFTEGGDDRRIVAGMCESGTLRPGDHLIFYPSGKTTDVARIEEWYMDPTAHPEPTEVTYGKSCGFTTTTQIYVRRGEIACKVGEEAPRVGKTFRASVFWLGSDPLVMGKEYGIKSCTAKTSCKVTAIHSVLDASNLEKDHTPTSAGKHAIADCTFTCEHEIAFDVDPALPATGRFVLIDGYEISGGGIIKESLGGDGKKRNDNPLTPGERRRYLGQVPLLVHCDDAAYAKILERALFEEDRIAYFTENEQAIPTLLDAGLVVLTTTDCADAHRCTGSMEDDITEILLATKAGL